MQSKSSQETFSVISSLLTSSSPEQFLLEQYSEILQTENIQLHYCRMYLYHLQLNKKMKNQILQINSIKQKIKEALEQTTPKKICKEMKQIKHQQNSHSHQNTHKQKRMRRTANQISRHFVCSVQNCRKQYGSEGSLNQHMKLKHDINNYGQQGWANQSALNEKRDSKGSSN